MAEAQPSVPYRVLARKYRPRHFDELIGQEALVRTLRNAIDSGRIAHAFMLTGVRGVGKTTTARIIAKALNYTGKDGKAGPTTGPTDDCEICRAIADDRHPDVIEMDAASRRGIDEIRELIDGVRYAPVSARYKVYIIDEVHMLTKEAFNALLKTLEEPPPHVKFIFATTEIRKVPVTVLSRCQRFDLKRVDIETLAAHYKKVCQLEKVEAEDEAIAMIARAADGSVRDGLSLLDQAIALGGAKVTTEQVRAMLGLADRARMTDLLEQALKGEVQGALAVMDDLSRSGADALTIMQDLLELAHILTRYRAVPALAEKDSGMATDTRKRLAALSQAMTMPALGRAWQILLKGISEVQMAPHPLAAAEMIIIRLAYASDLPDPGELVKKIKSGDYGAAATGAARLAGAATRTTEPAALKVAGGGVTAAMALPAQEPVYAGELSSAADIEALLRTNGRMKLAGEVFYHLRLGRIETGRIEFAYDQEQAPALMTELSQALKEITGERWLITEAKGAVQTTLAAQKESAENTLREEAKAHPVVAEVLRLFPGADVRVKRN